MLMIPLKTSATSFDLFVILEDENIERLKEHDPAEILPGNCGPAFNGLGLRSVQICYLSPGEVEEAVDLLRDGQINEVIKRLLKGWRFRPEHGDHDQGPQRFLGN